MSHFRTLTFVVEIDETTDLRYCGVATDAARKALEEAGFNVRRGRNEHNETGEMPPATTEIAW